MFESKSSKVLAALLVLPFLFTVQGCTDDEVLGTLAGIAVVGGAVAIGAAAGGHDHDRGDRGDYDRGDRGDCCRGGGDRGGHGGHRGRELLTADSLDFTSDVDTTDALNQTSALAQHYGVTFQAAAKVQSAMSGAVFANSLQPLYDIGMSRADIETFGQMKMISNQGIAGLAQKLVITTPQATNMLAQMIIDVRLQAADGSSDFWKSCTAAGSWKTPENSSCKSAEWSGCSPATGASFCASN